MKVLIFILQKEFRQIFRDKTILAMMLAMPTIQLIIMPLAANFDIKNINIAFVNHDQSTYYIKPEGWDNQVKNDIIFNYMLQYEKLLLSPTSHFEMIGLVEVDAGTLSNKITSGLTFRMGTHNSYFLIHEKTDVKSTNNNTPNYKRVQFLFFVKPTFTVFMDNSTLQGGMTTGQFSPYTISQDSLTHYYMQFEYGVILGTGNVGIAIAQKLRTGEYKGAPTQQVGNFTFFIGL